MPSRKIRLTAYAISAALIATVVVLYQYRYRWLDHNVRTVEPGRIFAGGYQYPGPLRNLVRRHSIRTIVNLRGTDNDLVGLEQTVADEMGVRFVSMPVIAGSNMQHRLDNAKRVARFVADPANQPVYFHCWGGRHRAGLVGAIYRIRYCGWTTEQAAEEMNQYGADTEPWPEELLRRYVKQRDRRTASRSLAHPQAELF